MCAFVSLIHGTRVYICALLQLVFVAARLYAHVHVRGDKRALGVSRGEGLWNMESSRVVLSATPVL